MTKIAWSRDNLPTPLKRAVDLRPDPGPMNEQREGKNLHQLSLWTPRHHQPHVIDTWISTWKLWQKANKQKKLAVNGKNSYERDKALSVICARTKIKVPDSFPRESFNEREAAWGDWHLDSKHGKESKRESTRYTNVNLDFFFISLTKIDPRTSSQESLGLSQGRGKGYNCTMPQATPLFLTYWSDDLVRTFQKVLD